MTNGDICIGAGPSLPSDLVIGHGRGGLFAGSAEDSGSAGRYLCCGGNLDRHQRFPEPPVFLNCGVPAMSLHPHRDEG